MSRRIGQFRRLFYHRRRSSPPRPQRYIAEMLESRMLLSAGDLDLTFNGSGQAVTDFSAFSPTAYTIAYSVAVQPDGKILSAGLYSNQRPGRFSSPHDFALTRYNVNGTPDTGFGDGGIVLTDFSGSDDDAQRVIVEPDGQILVAGSTYNTVSNLFEFALARYNPDGSLDQGFGTGGKLTTPFSNHLSTSANAVAVDAQGNILVAGSTTGSTADFAIARYSSGGALDPSFGNAGRVVTDFSGRDDFAKSIVLQPDGKIVVGGYSSTSLGPDFALARYNPDGTLDSTYGTGGQIITVLPTGRETIRNLVLVSGGKLLAQGSGSLVRYDSSGQLDPSFGVNGIVNTELSGHGGDREGICIAPGGKIIVCGTTRSITGQYFAWIIGRYTPDGILDDSFGTDGEVLTQFTGYDDGNDVTLSPEGKIVVVGLAGVIDGSADHFAVARYLNDGVIPVDTSLSLAPATGVFGGTTTISATLTSSGASIAGAVISFQLNGTTVGTAITDANGVAVLNSVSLSGISAGTYNGAVTAEYAGDSTHNPSSAVNSLTVTDENLLGMVWVDFNDDGVVDFGEQGIDGVTITLSGFDDLQNAVNISKQTADGGIYTFNHIRPGNYVITEGAVPAGYVEAKDALGSLGGDATVQNVFSNIRVGANQDGLNYNFGERPVPGSAETAGQASGGGFWANKQGQALIQSFGGTDGNGHPKLSAWLALTLPHIFGADAGSNDLEGMTPAQVAQVFQQRFMLHDKLDAQMMAAALNVYATSSALGGPQAAAYGFTVTQYGLGNSTFNVGADGAAFNVTNGTVLTIMQILESTDQQSALGVLYNGDTTLRKLAKDAFGTINAGGN